MSASNRGPGGCVPWEEYESTRATLEAYRNALGTLAEKVYGPSVQWTSARVLVNAALGLHDEPNGEQDKTPWRIVPPLYATPGAETHSSEDFNAMIDAIYASVNTALDALYAEIERIRGRTPDTSTSADPSAPGNDGPS